MCLAVKVGKTLSIYLPFYLFLTLLYTLLHFLHPFLLIFHDYFSFQWYYFLLSLSASICCVLFHFHLHSLLSSLSLSLSLQDTHLSWLAKFVLTLYTSLLASRRGTQSAPVLCMVRLDKVMPAANWEFWQLRASSYLEYFTMTSFPLSYSDGTHVLKFSYARIKIPDPFNTSTW